MTTGSCIFCLVQRVILQSNHSLLAFACKRSYWIQFETHLNAINMKFPIWPRLSMYRRSFRLILKLPPDYVTYIIRWLDSHVMRPFFCPCLFMQCARIFFFLFFYFSALCTTLDVSSTTCLPLLSLPPLLTTSKFPFTFCPCSLGIIIRNELNINTSSITN